MKNKKIFDLEKIFLLTIFLIFISFSTFFILKTNQGISPDENYHYNVSLAYSESWGLPENTESTYVYGDISRIPFLYFWINGRVLNLNSLNIKALTLLRVINLFYSSITVLFTYLLSKEIIKKKFLRLLPSLMLVSSLMFVFLSSAVSYDNLTNLLSVISVYALVKYYKVENLKYLNLWLLIALLGILTKFTIIPLLFIEFLILAYLLFKERRKIKIEEFLRQNKVLLIITSIVLIVTLIFFGTNLFKYGSPLPSCDDVMSYDQCMRNAVFARGENTDKLELFSKEGIYTVIKERYSPYEYFTKWMISMSSSIFGIFGHKQLPMPGFFASIYVLNFLIFLSIFIRKFSAKYRIENIIALITAFYVGVLLVFQNYKTYLMNNLYHVALQGRYLFPVLSLVYILMIAYLIKIEKKYVRRILLLLLVLTWTIGCIPFFITLYPEGWFN